MQLAGSDVNQRPLQALGRYGLGRDGVQHDRLHGDVQLPIRQKQAAFFVADDRHGEELRPYRFQAQPGEPVFDESGGGGAPGCTGAAVAESGEFLNVGHEEIRRRRLNGGGSGRHGDK